MIQYDVIIIGSGPAGVQAAAEAIKAKQKVLLISTGISEEIKYKKIPDLNFEDIRRSDFEQKSYFLGDNFSLNLARQAKAGTHLTPPRQYMIDRSEELFPRSETRFSALLSTGLGGLGISWGANCFTYSDEELVAVGISPSEIEPFYREIALDMGVSGDQNAATANDFFRLSSLLPSVKTDDNCRNILQKYMKRSLSDGFVLGPSFLALLTEDLGGRSKNKLRDMDFWDNQGESIWRPDILLRQLRQDALYHEQGHLKVESFKESAEEVLVDATDIRSGKSVSFSGKLLFVCCGALGSARLVARSLGVYDRELPFLCNGNVWMASLNLGIFGRNVSTYRHSLSQLTGGLKVGSNFKFVAHFYSYRSLLLFRLVPMLPLPYSLAVIFLRLIMNCFTLVNIQFADSFERVNRSLKLTKEGKLIIHGCGSLKGSSLVVKDLKKFRRFLLNLFCLPLATQYPEDGASIHYAGTLSHPSIPGVVKVDSDGCLSKHRRVFVADSSHWKSLPAKGLTFTLMANARRIVKKSLERTL